MDREGLGDMLVFLRTGVPGLLVLGLWVFCILDVIMSEETIIRNLPKGMWLLLVVILPVVGSIAWLIAGRPEGAAFRVGDTRRRPAAKPLAPDDDPRFLSQLEDQRRAIPRADEDRARRLREWEDELRRREEDLRRRGDGGSEPAPPTDG